MAMIIVRKNQIIGLIETLRKIYGDKEINSKQCSDLRKFIKIFVNFMKVTICFLNISTIIKCFLFGVNHVKEVLWIPSCFDGIFTLILVNVWSCFTSVTSLSLHLGCEVMIVTLITLTAIAFENFYDEIQRFEENEKLKEFIQKHNKLFELSSKLKSTLSSMLLMHFLQSSLGICIVGFEILTSNDVNKRFAFLTFLCANICHIFALCYFSQKVIDASQNISKGIFEICDWYATKNMKLRRIFFLMILRSQKVENLTARGFKDISLESFSSVGEIKSEVFE
ncbi:hypothetical protein PVAND_013407 [Polypedilum vanderplanki]|uniref:Odorant receptor n=1 Tax=Polypedilum vanderplanki TaxID=319348 RepID=A0A9J6CRB1_POLVA|nr:hypothetical protein PVAND_013407 [Polypedilum vanderplanki]